MKELDKLINYIEPGNRLQTSHQKHRFESNKRQNQHKRNNKASCEKGGIQNKLTGHRCPRFPYSVRQYLLRTSWLKKHKSRQSNTQVNKKQIGCSESPGRRLTVTISTI